MIELSRREYEVACKQLTEALLKLPVTTRLKYVNRKNWEPFIPASFYFSRGKDHLVQVTEQTAQRVKMLQSGHGVTIVRVWVMRNLK